MLKEAKVTVNILNWLEQEGWEIICHDFPQSGTGIMLHPNNQEGSKSKNQDGIIPDIVAVKNGKVVFFENKDRFVLSDFEKIWGIKSSNKYSISLRKLINSPDDLNIFYGIGIPQANKHVEKSMNHLDKVDFIISVSEDGVIRVEYDEYLVFQQIHV